jgi:hypothetical protein
MPLSIFCFDFCGKKPRLLSPDFHFFSQKYNFSFCRRSPYFTCFLCPTPSPHFMDYFQLNQHFFAEHQGSCLEHALTFNSAEEYYNHTAQEHLGHVEMCFECQKLSWSTSESERHQQLFHFARGNVERNHAAKDQGGPASVEKSDVTLITEQQATLSSVVDTTSHATKAELCSVIELETGYQCHACHKEFQLFSQLLAHVKLKHPGQTSFSCFSCSFKAASPLRLKAHLIAVHSEKSVLIKCIYCDVFFSEIERLKVSVLLN